MGIEITFSGGQGVDAHLSPLTIATNQDKTAPSPFSLFLASIGTCAGFYVLSFCQQRGLPVDGIRIVQSMHAHPGTKKLESIELDIQIPPDFPEKYHDALVRSASQCAVKKALAQPPAFDIHTSVTEGVGVSAGG